MQYDVKTPQEYLEGLEDDWRKEKLLQVRTIILSEGPEIEEVIEYKMLGYTGKYGPLFNLNAQKNHVGLYVGHIRKIDPNGKLLEPFDLGKGCIRIRKSIDLSETKLREFIKKAVQLWQKGSDLSC